MLERLRPSLQIGLSHDRVTVLRTVGLRPVTTVLTDQICAMDHLDESIIIAQLYSVLTASLHATTCARAPTTVVLADQWVRYFVVTPPQNIRALQDCKAAAAMRFQALFGQSCSHWQLRGDWHSRRPFLVCAIPMELQDMLLQLTATFKLTSASIEPHFVAVYNRRRRAMGAGQWLGVVDGRILTLGAVTGEYLMAVRVAYLSEDAATSDWLIDHVTREALRLGLVAPVTLILAGDVPASWRALKGPLTCRHVDPDTTTTSFPPLSSGMRLARAGMR